MSTLTRTSFLKKGAVGAAGGALALYLTQLCLGRFESYDERTDRGHLRTPGRLPSRQDHTRTST